MSHARRPPPPAAKHAAHAGPRGPIALTLAAGFALIGTSIISWMIGTLIEVAGIIWFWPDEGENHSRNIVAEDLAYIAAAPRSFLIDDTVAFSKQVMDWVQTPYRALGALSWYERTHAPQSDTATVGRPGAVSSIARAGAWHISRVVLISMYVAQDTLLRLSVAIFALPAFALACLLGAVDGLMRRDLRRWGGGRESSFVYHHAKRWTVWSLTIGFTFYLAWPFGGFNPAYMVLVFTALVAMFLSTTLSAFKKYL